MRRMIACLSLVLLLSSCSGDHEASPGGSHGASSDGFETRAREVAERWQGSADDHAWRKGFVALEVLNPHGWNHVRRIPAWVNRSSHNGAWQLAAKLPTDAPHRADVRWPDGEVSQVPLISAARAYEEFSKSADLIEEECPAKRCRPLRVTGAGLGKVPLETSRGTIQVPAWMFTVEGVEQKKVHVAVDPSAVTARPERTQRGIEEVMAFDLVAGKPDELLLRYGFGACDTVQGPRAYETDQLVVVDMDEEGSSSGHPCPAILKTATTTVALARPLGDRLVLDSGTGLPVLRGLNRR
ncbi:hypothetical protein EDD27_0677 [Nonomuraea polychroma]|uniref:Sporulation and spore germination protein n=1 Tax=Nonomuraea polychroma TaxID=46176 RepID=A0A438LYF5_9ACTN|nr:hypothetical protein [Nonomuraea polychroma]RVX38377.1 hypothetical protein EDD27_0677 [Nonomuraea polychroma]